jgi:hypothetical protein
MQAKTLTADEARRIAANMPSCPYKRRPVRSFPWRVIATKPEAAESECRGVSGRGSANDRRAGRIRAVEAELLGEGSLLSMGC